LEISRAATGLQEFLLGLSKSDPWETYPVACRVPACFRWPLMQLMRMRIVDAVDAVEDSW